MKRILPYAIYPLALLASSIAYFAAYQFTHLHLIGLYAGVSLSAIIIFTIEKYQPLHHEWIPNNKELKEDFLFYGAIVQVAFPIILYLVGITLLKNMNYKEGIIFDIWPHTFPIALQFFILAFTGEFLQYCWHRLCHTYSFLWHIHVPHHLPNKLYSWNTSRFHFLDKLIEFFITIFLFLAFGLSIEILSYYYLFYATTGYIQHSNLDVRLGWLDYIIASGETHRFHHDSNLLKSKCNYANNFVLYDLIFKTFKRNPAEKNTNVGIRSLHNPEGLVEETLYPVKHFKNEGLRIFITILMKSVIKAKVQKLRNASNNPTQAQNQWLFKLINKNQKTLFGSEHDFKNIKTIEQFKKNIPIRDYEEHRHYIEMILKGQTNILTKLSTQYFTKTSGTTGIPKYIPITNEVQKNYQHSQQVLSHSLFSSSPRYLDGEIFTIVGNEHEEYIYGKWSCGSMSGKLYSLAHKSIKAKHSLQTNIATLNDSNLKYLYLAAVALLSPKITFYVSPNPSTLIKIFETVNTHKAEILSLIENENDPILKKYSKMFNHAKYLLSSKKKLLVKDLWPQIKIISLWMEGSCSYLIPQIKKMIEPDTILSELGYISSEFYGTVPTDSNTDKQIPTLLQNYFEFIEKSDYENGIRETIGLEELKTNEEYYIIVTTAGGFYRYFVNDIVRVNSFYNKTPIISFSNKGKGITSLVGEKISEKQLVSFFEDQNNRSDLNVSFFICLADQINQSYTLYLESNLPKDSEAFEMKLDIYLKNLNIEYASKVTDQRLKPIKISFLKNGTSELYRNHCISKGQNETQFKFLHLKYLVDNDFPFNNHVIIK